MSQYVRVNTVAEVEYRCGLGKLVMGQYDAAIVDFDSAIRRDDNLAQAYYHRGLAKRNLGRYVDAITDFDMVIKKGRRLWKYLLSTWAIEYSPG